MSTRYGLKFGSGDPRSFTGLTPTFVFFATQAGVTMTPPGISEVLASGLYYFNYTPNATFTIFFIADGGSSVTDNSVRYLSGSLDPVAAVDQQLGFIDDSYGTTASPSTAFGFVKRLNEMWQADATFSKSTGIWSQYARGTSTLLYSKTLANSSSQVVKT